MGEVPLQLCLINTFILGNQARGRELVVVQSRRALMINVRFVHPSDQFVPGDALHGLV